MDNTELHRTLRKYALDGIWEAFETIQYYKKALSMEKPDSRLHAMTAFALSEVYKKSNNQKLTEAIGLFDEAIELNPNFAEAYKERGRAKLLNGDKDGSVEDMKKSLELNPKEEAGLNGEFKNLGPKPEALPGIF